MKPYVYEEGMSLEEQKNGAYWERNMLALLIAKAAPKDANCGWYTHGEWEGWSRVISLYDGAVTFHVPDDFDLGDLPKIEPNWDGHSTQEKWETIMVDCGITPSK
jgi:hypothetical protein